MSDDWPQGWYRGESPGTPAHGARPGYSRPQDPGWRPSGGGAWPDQPPSRGGRQYPGGPGAYPGGGGGGRRWRFWGQPGRHGRRIVTIIATVIVLLLVAVVGSYFWLNGKLNRSVTLPATTNVSSGTNWLITGADSRQGLSRTQLDQMHAGFDEGTLNSDSVMLLHMGSGKPILISIPRDSYVNIPGHGYNKLNASLGEGGPALLVQTIESVTGLQINHYMGIGFGGLVSVVNSIGGVQMCLPSSVSDSYSGVNLKAGCQNLNGDQALSFVRDRHSFATGDLQRIQDQRAFLKALLNKGMSPGVYLNPFKALPFASTSASSMSVDKGTSLLDLVQAAMALQNPESGTVPISNPAYFTPAGEAVKWDTARALQLFNALQKDQPVPTGLLQGTKVG
jgi:LCP family protein required for cell wall assembly